MATWVQVTLLHDDTKAIVNVDLVRYARPSPREDDATELVFTEDHTVDIKEKLKQFMKALQEGGPP